MMLRKKQFDRHISNLEAALDSEDDEEWESELNADQDTDIEDTNADDIAPPAYGHTDGKRVIGTTNKSSGFHHDRDFRESLESRLYTLFEQEMMRKDWRAGGGSLKAIQPVDPVGTASKHTPPGDKQKADGKLDSREVRAQSKPAAEYNKNRNLGSGIEREEESDETEQTTSGSEKAPQEA